VVFQGSTVLDPTAEDLHAHRAGFSYGRHGSPTTRVLQDVLMSLEGPQMRRRRPRAVGAGRDHHHPALGAERR
jgi:hypothetical protein